MEDKRLEARLAQLERELEDTRKELSNSPSFDSLPRGQLPNYVPPPYMQPNYQMPNMQLPYGMPSMPPLGHMPPPSMPMYAPHNQSDQFKQMLMQQAKLLEDTAQRMRVEKQMQQQLEYLQGENQHLSLELSRVRSEHASEVQEEVAQLRRELRLAAQREDSLVQELAEATQQLRNLEHQLSQAQAHQQEPPRHSWEDRPLREKPRNNQQEFQREPPRDTYQHSPREVPPSFNRESRRDPNLESKQAWDPWDVNPSRGSEGVRTDRGETFEAFEANYTPVRTQVNVSHNVSQILQWEEPSPGRVERSVAPKAPQEPNAETAKFVANIQSKISDLERDHDKLRREFERARSSGNATKEEQIRLELDINRTNLSRLRSKIKGYLD